MANQMIRALAPIGNHKTGDVWAVPGVSAELLVEQGLAELVDAAELSELSAQADAVDELESDEDDAGADLVDPSDDVAVTRPTTRANRAEWAGYVLTLGGDADSVAAATRDELVAMADMLEHPDA